MFLFRMFEKKKEEISLRPHPDSLVYKYTKVELTHKMKTGQIDKRVSEITKSVNNYIYNKSFDEDDFVTEEEVKKVFMNQLKFNRLHNDDNDVCEITHLLCTH